MHLLSVQAGALGDDAGPVDLGQDPADVIIVSAADTELAGLSQAHASLAKSGEPGPSLRLASLLNFSHPFTVDQYLDKTAQKSRLVIVRLLGGEAYWRYGLEQFSARLKESGVLFAALPGDDRPDETLRRASNIADEDYAALWACFVEGGADNYRSLLLYAGAVLSDAPRPPAARPLLRAGIYAPKAGVCDLAQLRAQHWREGRPVAALVFYRALMQGAGLHPVDRLFAALSDRGLNVLPVFVASLKDELSAATIRSLFAQAPPAIVLNATGFAVSSPQTAAGGGAGSVEAGEQVATVLDEPGAPVLQVAFSSSRRQDWADGLNGLNARDIAMNVSLPELDGRIFSRAVSFKGEAWYDEACQCPVSRYEALDDRVEFVAELAANWARLAAAKPGERRVAMVLANYPNKDGRLANGVGLDTPASVLHVMRAMARAGYAIRDIPADADALMTRILAGPTNWLTDRAKRRGGERLSLADYRLYFERLPQGARDRVQERWGAPEDDPFVGADGFALSVLRFGALVLGVQAARGYNINPKETYHDPALAPPHNYLAFYFWLRHRFGAHAVIHMGKHGNLEWLPGKSLALSAACFPEVALGPLPHIYPFIVNDPGEGTQAKRRAQAVIIDHLTPPLARAETYGPLKDLEALVDEYYQASSSDARRLKSLADSILALTSAERLDDDIGLAADSDMQTRLNQIDAYLCDLKESQIRDGLHVFGQTPPPELKDALLVALARVSRGMGEGGDGSLIRALAADLGLGEDFDPLDCDFAAPWRGPKPDILRRQSDELWRITGDVVERLELLALALVGGGLQADPQWRRAREVLAEIDAHIRPAIERTGEAETNGLLRALAGRFVAPGPSGAPTRGRLDVLPTGRNFHSLDSRALPTPTAWNLGAKSTELLIERHVQDEGEWPTAMTISMWGTSNMRTGGDDIAQAMALMGVRPVWDHSSYRVTGYEIIPLAKLNRPRVDVTVRISGFFRDAFPAQIELMDKAARAVMKLDEPPEQNPAARRFAKEQPQKGEGAGARIFGSKPGAYGAGLQALLDERAGSGRADFAAAYLAWGGYAYGGGQQGAPAKELFEQRLMDSDAVIHNQDNREHDLLDSDDYYQFEGGLAASIEHVSGKRPKIYHNDHSRPERPVIRTLEEEISRVMRARVANPKWINGVMRHGYKGAFEIAATVDYLFAFAATTGAVKNHHFDMLYSEFIDNEERAAFIKKHNPAAFDEIRQRLQEAIERGLWRPRSNRAAADLDEKQEGSGDEY